MAKQENDSILSGLLFSIAIGCISWMLGKRFPVIGGPVFAIFLGLIFSFFIKTDKLNKGITFTSKKILQYAIVFLGFNMNLFNIIQVGRESILIIAVTISVALVTAYLFSKTFKVPRDTAILIGVGSSICGGSAIAATAPVIQAKNEDVAKAISTIFFFNVMAALIFPNLGMMLGMTDYGFGVWSGTAINDTSSVVAAASSWSATVGNNLALEMATIVKLTRTLAIIPITTALTFYEVRRNASKSEHNFRISKIFPWFILFFLAASIINTAFSLNENFVHLLVDLGKFMIIMAMAAIGYSTDIKKILEGGIKPILLGFTCWVLISVSSLWVQSMLGIR